MKTGISRPQVKHPARRGIADLGDSKRAVYAVWIALLAMLILTVIVRPSLAAPASLQTIAVLAAVSAVVGLGQGAVIFTGGIDLSVPWIMSSVAIIFSGISNGRNELLLPALLIAIAVGAGIGLLNGIGSVYLGIHPVVMTLAVNTILQGAMLGYTGGLVTGSPPGLVSTFMRGGGTGIPAVLPALLVLAVVVTFVMRQTTYGRKLQAVGLNPEAARLAGVNSRAIGASTYLISGVCAALAGVMLAGLSGQSYLGMGDPYLLMSIAVVALGGAAFVGGRGHYLGTLGGALLLSLLTTLLMTFHLPEAARTIVQGLVILIAVIAAKVGLKKR